MKKILSIFVLIGVTFVATQTRATNLLQATSTLPQNEEWALMARSSLGQHVGQNYLREKISDASALDLEKRILAITAQGQNPRTFGGENFVQKLLAKYDGNQIGDSSLLNDDIFGLLALKSAGESGDVLSQLRKYILNNQNADGGWSFAKNNSSDSNTTAMAVAALRSVGSAPESAINYLMSTQKSDGGFAFTPNQDSDGASTAWVIIGLRAARAQVPSNAISYLEELQTSNGSFKWKPGDGSGSSLITSYAVIALSEKTLPIRVVSNATPTPRPDPTPAPNAKPAPLPVPTPSPNPTLIPPTPTLTPAPIPPIPNLTKSAIGYPVTIIYPGNKIYVGQISLSSGSPRAIETLTKAANEINLLYEIKNTSFGPFVNSINGYPTSGTSGWLYAVNDAVPNISASDYVLKPGDFVQWFYGPPNTQPY